jgi:hypothetical protein
MVEQGGQTMTQLIKETDSSESGKKKREAIFISLRFFEEKKEKPKSINIQSVKGEPKRASENPRYESEPVEIFRLAVDGFKVEENRTEKRRLEMWQVECGVWQSKAYYYWPSDKVPSYNSVFLHGFSHVFLFAFFSFSMDQIMLSN